MPCICRDIKNTFDEIYVYVCIKQYISSICRCRYTRCIIYFYSIQDYVLLENVVSFIVGIPYTEGKKETSVYVYESQHLPFYENSKNDDGKCVWRKFVFFAARIFRII